MINPFYLSKFAINGSVLHFALQHIDHFLKMTMSIFTKVQHYSLSVACAKEETENTLREVAGAIQAYH